MKLVFPDIKYKDSYIEALKDGFYLGSQSPKTAEEISLIEKNFENYLSQKLLMPYEPTPKLRDDGKYYVNSPQITFWLIDDEKFIGAFNLRTSLNEFLMYVGGNVGYGIAPKYRRRGYATKGLSLLIEEARKRKMDRLLVAAKESNIGSWKAIEHNGGILENMIKLPWEKNGEYHKRYWIEIR